MNSQLFLQNKTLDDIGKFVDASSCFRLNVFLFKSNLFHDFLGHRLLARNSDTVQPKNVRKSVNCKYFCLMILYDIDRHRLHCCQESPRLLANSVSLTSGKRTKEKEIQRKIKGERTMNSVW